MWGFRLKIPDGKIFAQIPLEACKAYPTRLFERLNVTPLIAVSDRNTRKDDTKLMLTLIPGCKTALHPQIGFIVKGPYHIETIGYSQTDPFTWKSWIEFYLDARDLKQIIEALIRIELALQGVS